MTLPSHPSDVRTARELELIEALKFYANGTANPSGHEREPEDYDLRDYTDGSSYNKPIKFGTRARAALAKVQS